MSAFNVSRHQFIARKRAASSSDAKRCVLAHLSTVAAINRLEEAQHALESFCPDVAACRIAAAVQSLSSAVNALTRKKPTK